MRMSSRVGVCALGLLMATGLGARRAEAQVALDHYTPAPLPTDGFTVSRPEGLPHLKVGFQFEVDYAKDPLVLRSQGREIPVVSDQLVGHAMFGLGLWDRLSLFAGLPVQLMQKGKADQTDGMGLGDAWVGARLMFVGGERRHGGLGLEAIARLPTAEWSNGKQLYSGDEKGAYDVALMGEARVARLTLGLRSGVRLRPGTQEIDSRVTIGHELLFAGYLSLRLIDALHLHAELFGNSPFDSFFHARATPVEALFGLKAWAGGFLIGAAAGPGMSRGYGTPEYRIVGTLGFAQPPEKPVPVDPDPDHDGVRSPWERCPTQPEDRDEFEDQDGCPDRDNDGDGFRDGEDRCPNEAEDKDGFADEDGCLDADNDGDEILDAHDKCPLETEDADGFEDQDGCLDRDNDGDGIPDGQDRCPNEAGGLEEQGCPPPPAPPVAVLEKGEIRINERIEFQVNKDKLLPSSTPVLEAVQEILLQNPDVVSLRVEGHTDRTGGEAKNMTLSRKRAAAVARWLVDHGIAQERLEAVGCGPKRPIEPNITAEGRRRNRRVEFHVIIPAPANPIDSSMCKAAAPTPAKKK